MKPTREQRQSTTIELRPWPPGGGLKRGMLFFPLSVVPIALLVLLLRQLGIDLEGMDFTLKLATAGLAVAMLTAPLVIINARSRRKLGELRVDAKSIEYVDALGKRVHEVQIASCKAYETWHLRGQYYNKTPFYSLVVPELAGAGNTMVLTADVAHVLDEAVQTQRKQEPFFRVKSSDYIKLRDILLPERAQVVDEACARKGYNLRNAVMGLES